MAALSYKCQEFNDLLLVVVVIILRKKNQCGSDATF